MKYKIALQESEEGYSVSVPGLPGCWSQGETEEEAIANIQDAIQEYLAAANDFQLERFKIFSVFIRRRIQTQPCRCSFPRASLPCVGGLSMRRCVWRLRCRLSRRGGLPPVDLHS